MIKQFCYTFGTRHRILSYAYVNQSKHSIGAIASEKALFYINDTITYALSANNKKSNSTRIQQHMHGPGPYTRARMLLHIKLTASHLSNTCSCGVCVPLCDGS